MKNLRNQSGFTLVEISIAVAVVGMLSALAIPSFSAARRRSVETTKSSNVRLLNNAVQMWAMDNIAGDDSPIGIGITNYIKGGFQQLSIGSISVNITNIIEKSVSYTFTKEDIY